MNPINAQKDQLVRTLDEYKTKLLNRNIKEPDLINTIALAIEELGKDQIALEHLEKISEHIRLERAKQATNMYSVEGQSLGFAYLGEVLKLILEYIKNYRP